MLARGDAPDVVVELPRRQLLVHLHPQGDPGAQIAAALEQLLEAEVPAQHPVFEQRLAGSQGQRRAQVLALEDAEFAHQVHLFQHEVGPDGDHRLDPSAMGSLADLDA